MSFADIYRPSHLAVSLELFPPKTPAGEDALFGHVARMMAYQPDFITCTYGAGGSTRDKTLQIVTRVKQEFRIPVATHLTLVGSRTDQLRSYLESARQAQIDFVVALRGDPPQGHSAFVPTAGGLRHANELVQLIQDEFSEFGIAVAGYPEKHQEAASFEDDIRNLKNKVEAGASVVLTQLFYDNQDFWRFRERYEQAGIRVPLVPGILPITNLNQIQRIASLCGSKIPTALATRLAERDDPLWQLAVGVEHAQRQIRQLIDQGVPGLHFYVLNQSQAMLELFEVFRPANARHQGTR